MDKNCQFRTLCNSGSCALIFRSRRYRCSLTIFFLGRKLRVFSCWPAQSSLVCWPAQSHSFSWFFWFAAAVWQDFSEKLRYFSCWLAQFILVCSAVQFSVDLCHRCSLTRFFLWQKSWEISAGDCLSSVSSQFQLIFPNEEARWINLHNHKSKFL